MPSDRAVLIPDLIPQDHVRFEEYSFDQPACGPRMIELYVYPFEYPFAPAKVVDFFIEYYGPTNRAYGSLNDAGKQALHDDLTALWARNNGATDGTTRVLGEYIEVIGTR